MKLIEINDKVKKSIIKTYNSCKEPIIFAIIGITVIDEEGVECNGAAIRFCFKPFNNWNSSGSDEAVYFHHDINFDYENEDYNKLAKRWGRANENKSRTEKELKEIFKNYTKFFEENYPNLELHYRQLDGY